MNNKLFSNAQEKMIADQLSWRVVSGSGARDCYPGDVVSDSWLGECKTHTEVSDRVCFVKSHWTKICKEASSKFKYPALFVDNGSQKSAHTWVIFPFKCCNASDFKATLSLPVEIRKNIVFSDKYMRIVYHDDCETNDGYVVYKIEAFDDDLALLPFSSFVELFGGE